MFLPRSVLYLCLLIDPELGQESGVLFIGFPKASSERAPRLGPQQLPGGDKHLHLVGSPEFGAEIWNGNTEATG